jgi:hypothetical protein
MDPMTAFRLSPELKERVDFWAAGQPDRPSRSEAIRRLIEMSLGAKPTGKKPAAKASELAAQAIDHLGDPSATEDEQAFRKRRLLKGPKEFRDIRTDRPKAKH